MAPRLQRLHLVLAILAALVGAYQLFATWRVVDFLRNPLMERPIYLGRPWPAIIWTTDEARVAGLQRGDRVLSLNGEPVTGLATQERIRHAAHPGDGLEITYERDGRSRTVRVPFTPSRGPAHPIGWVWGIVVLLLTPTLALAAGFWTAFVRVRDPMAWLVLGIMISLAFLSHTFFVDVRAWPAAISLPALALQTVATTPWPIWLLLFGIYFPERWNVDRRLPWLKWLLIVPPAVYGIVAGIAALGQSVAYAATQPWTDLADALRRPIAVFTMVPVSLFFASLHLKLWGQSLSADSRRRLKLLLLGATVAFTPLFVVVLGSLIGRTQLFTKEYIALWAFLFLAIFPVTLAYVIVVQRALDVRVVIRQGIQYALARRGLLVLQFVLICAIILVAVNYAMAHGSNRTLVTTATIGVSLVTGVVVNSAGRRAGLWIDRRFFRDAYNAEIVLSALSDDVRAIVETRPLLETVATRLTEALHLRCLVALLADDGSFRPAYVLGYGDPPHLSLPRDSSTMRRLAQTSEPLHVYFDDENSWIYRDALNEAERHCLREMQAQLLLPLPAKDRLVGVLSLGPKKSEEPYSPSDVRLLRSVAGQTGLALENSRLVSALATEAAQRERINRELEIAREVQEQLFPQNLPVVPGLHFAGHCRPARGVGGDYYDFVPLSNGQLGIAIGDVSGKGIPAALLMASLQASLRGQTIDTPADLASMMSKVNRLIYAASASNRYATFFYAQYDPATRALVYSNAGHNPPMLFSGDKVLRLSEGGPPVGLLGPARYSQASVQLQPGDLLVLFTDGVSEAEDAQQREWGEEALACTIRENAHCTAAGMIQVILDAADAFAYGAPQHDDITLVVVKVL